MGADSDENMLKKKKNGVPEKDKRLHSDDDKITITVCCMQKRASWDCCCLCHRESLSTVISCAN